MNLMIICSMLWTIAGNPAAETPSVIHWQAERVLVWTDFQGIPPEGDPAQAKSYAGLRYGLQEVTEHSAVIKIEAVFDPAQSWVRLEDKIPSTLAHEQLHFDITEVCARACRKIIANEEFTPDNYLDKLQEIVQHQFEVNNVYQEKFDIETSFPRNISNEQQWSGRIRNKLSELEDYRDIYVRISF